MAKLTKNEEYIVDMYVRYFGKAPSKAEIAKYNDFKTPKLILTEIRGDADDTKPLNTKEFVNNAFQNLFGRDANTKEMNKYSKVVDAGKDLPINAIVKSAKKADKGVYEAKKAIAIMLAEKENTTNYNLDKITKDTYADVYNLKTKKLLVDSVAQLETKIDAMPDNVSGTTFNLTTSADNFVGGEKGDVFNAYGHINLDGSFNPTLTGIDSLDGGAGKDTLNVKSDNGITAVTPTIKNIETINLESAAAIGTTLADFDTTTFTGAETLNVTKATAAYLKAAATTDVNVSGVTGDIEVTNGKNVVVNDNTVDTDIIVNGAAGTITVTDTKNAGTAVTDDITIDGGTNVTVTATADASSGNIEIGTTKQATGDVKVTQNLNSDGTAALNAGTIKVTGGKTVDVTVNANNVAKVATAADDIVVGTITVKGGDNTTTVTVTQNDNTETFTSAKVAEVKDTQTITFKGLAAGENVSITDGTNALTFIASKTLTAEEVAAAFAELVASDRQDNGGKVANGVYTGQFAANWSAKSVSGATVTFEAPASNTTTLANNASSVAPTFGTVVGGTAASGGVESTNAVVYGQVVIDNTAKTGTTDTIKTVTVDGYATSSTIASNALTDLTLKNSATNATITLTSTVASLNVTLDNVVGTVDLDGAAGVTTLKTLNLTTTGEDSDIILDTQAVETLTIAAAADLNVSGSDLAALKTVTVTGAGDVTLGDISSKLETLTASAATGDISATVDNAKATVTTGSGNDTITLSNVAAISKAIDLGDGDDTLILAAGTTAIPTAAVKGGAGVDTISMTSASADAYDANENFKNAISGFERLEISNTYGVDNNTSATLTLDLANLGFTSYVVTSGTLVDADNAATESDILKLTKLAANSTVVLTAEGYIEAVLATATGTADVINVIIDANDTTINAGKFTVNDVENVNITAQGKFTDDGSFGSTKDDGKDDAKDIASLTLSADKVKTITIDGYADLTLDTDPLVSTVLTKVDASKMTGALTYEADLAKVEVIGGSGADKLTANANEVKINGGAGNDIITINAGFDKVVVDGGTGNDSFVIKGAATTIDNYAVFNNVTAGDTFDFSALGVTNFVSTKVSLSAGATESSQALTNEATKVLSEGEMGWFQYNGNTFIVVNVDGNGGAANVDTYEAGHDTVVMITGLKDLSTASFNSTSDTLEIA